VVNRAKDREATPTCLHSASVSDDGHTIPGQVNPDVHRGPGRATVEAQPTRVRAGVFMSILRLRL